MSRRLDRTRPYAQVHGLPGVAFEQDNLQFTQEGRLVGAPADEAPESDFRTGDASGAGKGGVAPISTLPKDALDEMMVLARSAPEGGSFLEVGVYKGGSAYRLLEEARRRKVPLYCFDTYDGIPYEEDGDLSLTGEFGDVSAADVINALGEGAVVDECVGIFPASMPESVERIAFAHLDMTQRRAYREALPVILAKMLPGGIILMEDYGQVPEVTEDIDALLGQDRIVRTNAGRGMYVVPKA